MEAIVPLSNGDVRALQQAYRSGIKRGQASLRPALEGAIGFSIAHVDKYSQDQTAYAAARFREEQAWRRGPRINATAMLRRIRSGPLQLSGMEFERYFPGGPEEGDATSTGNIFVAQGLTNLVSLWMGLTGTAVNKLTQTGATPVCGVGTGTAAAATADATLISNGGSAYYQGFDAATLGTTSTNGVIIGTSTFASAVANFNWNEWCWATGTGLMTPGSNGGSVAGSPFATASSWQMVNHKTNVALGSKASGSSWVFSTQFVLS
jgi:hypothetical protein